MNTGKLMIITIVATIAVLCSGCAQPSAAVASPTVTPSPVPSSSPAVTASPVPAVTSSPGRFAVSSAAFQAGETLPAKYTADGADLSPPLAWNGAPVGTRSFAIIADDPDASGGVFTHWVIFNLPEYATGLPEGMQKQPITPDLAIQGKNDFGGIGYGGPAPPAGSVHHYRFTVYALDDKMDRITVGATADELKAQMQGHILAQDTLTGLYGH
jgi:Raf kinase inhibitor-like YbhB/YbcL family protein